MFGSDVHHLAPEFISRVYTSGCTAVDAFRQDWADLLRGRTAWVLLPTRAVSRALSLVETYSIPALFVMPSGAASNEGIQLHQLIGARISQPFTVPKFADSLSASARVPASTLNPTFLGLAVYSISWSWNPAVCGQNSARFLLCTVGKPSNWPIDLAALISRHHSLLSLQRSELLIA